MLVGDVLSLLIFNFCLASSKTLLFTFFCLCRLVSAFQTIWLASISKCSRNSSRCSLSPKPSVPSAINVPGNHFETDKRKCFYIIRCSNKSSFFCSNTFFNIVWFLFLLLPGWNVQFQWHCRKDFCSSLHSTLQEKYCNLFSEFRLLLVLHLK